jgi:hypothetical protein
MMTLVIDMQRAAMTNYTDFSCGGTQEPYKPLSNGAMYRPVAKPDFGPGGRSPRRSMYILPEYPGESPINWRRQLYGNLAHGVKYEYIDLFQFMTSLSAAVTNDYTDDDQGSYQGIR